MDCVNNMPNEEILLYFQDPEILVSARRRVPDITRNPRKNTGSRPSNGLPWTETMHTRCCIFFVAGRVYSMWPLIWGKEHKNNCMHSLRHFPLWSVYTPYVADIYMSAVSTTICRIPWVLEKPGDGLGGSHCTCKSRTVFTFFKWLKRKSIGYIMTHENKLTFKFQCPWIKVFQE